MSSCRDAVRHVSATLDALLSVMLRRSVEYYSRFISVVVCHSINIAHQSISLHQFQKPLLKRSGEMESLVVTVEGHDNDCPVDAFDLTGAECLMGNDGPGMDL